MSYTIYLDKDENFSCDATIKNASYKNSSARLIVECEGVSLIFYGVVDKEKITVPIKGNLLKKFVTEQDSGKVKLEVIVENTIVEPWTSDVIFENYNKVEIKEVKNIVSTPIVEVKINQQKPQHNINTSEKNTEPDIKQKMLSELNKKFKIDGITSNTEKKLLIKKMLQSNL